MTITSITEFAESTAFERLVLDRLCPVFSNDESEVLDLREAMAGTGPSVINLDFTESACFQAVENTKLNIMPLLFGAAWKILDLLIELALHQAGIKPDQKNKYSITKKVDAAKNGKGTCALSSADQPLWAAVCAAYAATFEHRHCLVHRLAAFSEYSLQLSGQTASGATLKPLEATELYAFVSVAQITASVVIAGGLDARTADHLRYELDCLQQHTGLALLGGLKASKPVTLKLTLTSVANNQFEIDFVPVHAMAKKRYPTVHLDAWIDIPDGSGRTLFSRLEDLPLAKKMIDLGSLPPYLSFR